MLPDCDNSGAAGDAAGSPLTVFQSLCPTAQVQGTVAKAGYFDADDLEIA
jgi:hypothetical protein